MASSLNPHKNDNPSTYILQPRKNQTELTRLMIQDQMITAGMGGVLPEQADPSIFRRVLDIGCGPGGWIIEAAQAYPTMSFVGIDISQRMVEHARAQAKAQQVNNRVEFQVMDALRPFEFPVACFDLVNLRFGSSYVRTWDWPKVVSEMLRVASPDGILRITDSEIIQQSNSSALRRLHEMLQCTLYRSGHLFTQESTGLIDHLAQLLDQYGCEQVQTKTYALEYRAGTVEGQAYYENIMLGMQHLRPSFQKRNCVREDYETIYQQALKEMCQPDFHVTWNILTAWGGKPDHNHNSPGGN